MEDSADCLKNIEKTMADQTSSMYQFCDCMEDCNSLRYSNNHIVHRLSSRQLQNFTSKGDFALESEVRVFFGASEYIGYMRYSHFEITSFLSKIGATLWLFLGASLLSVVEVLSFLTLRFYNNLFMHSRMN